MTPEEEYDRITEKLKTDNDYRREVSQDPEALEKFFEEVAQIGDNGSMPGRIWLDMLEAMERRFVYMPEATQGFTDEDMLLIYRDMLTPWIGDKSTIQPVFVGIQTAFTAAVKNNHEKCFRWLIDNFDIEKYSIDGLDLHIALKEHRINILWFFATHVDKENYGFEGLLADQIHPSIRANFRQVKDQLPTSLITELEKLKILKD